MNSLATIYNILVKIEGPILARETVSSILYSAVAELQSENTEIDSDSLDAKLLQTANDFIAASKKDVA